MACQVLNIFDALDPDVDAGAVPWPSIYRLTNLRQLLVRCRHPHDRSPHSPTAQTACPERK
jgi:hypothetical protein